MIKNTDLSFKVIFGTMIFSALFGLFVFWALDQIEHFIYSLVFILLSFILYINILRLFLLEAFRLGNTRANEILNYFLMYCVTAAAILSPLLMQSTYIYEVSFVRKLIIFFAAILLAKYFFYMILAPWQDIVHRLKHYRFFDFKKYNPLVSVMIPAWNEEVGILATVNSLLASRYRNMEIIIINDGSTDSSDKIIRDFIKKHKNSLYKDISINYFYQENSGKGSALNRAIALAKGDILVSIDADCVVDPGAIGAFVAEFKDPKVMGAVGNVKIGNKDSMIGTVQYLEFLFSFYFKRAESLIGSIYIIGGAAGAFRREVFERVGLYSTNNITEDIELTVRMQDAGMKIIYVPKAIVYTEGASDLTGLKKQRLRWKMGRFQTFFQHRHLFFSTKKKHNKYLSMIVMPLAVFSEIQLLFELPFVIFLYVFSLLNSDFTSFMSGVVIVGFMFVIQFMFYEKSARRWSFVALAPIGWMLFYIATYVEMTALLRSIRMLLFHKELDWQRWNRKGIAAYHKESN
ncbi:MAG: glycosyltransferase [Patescibacteria group bacterium]|nr:glycosyltransferase [Patescibacteria group bacterium]